ncbi:hypothetical protein HYDPIDRAFT_109386 [Hydnomerulius pinastri MD-312]|nr:hypothetical protein HYDPIDRAFT_109386 [Hydnomerulius pinastri MD-312]
MTFVGVGMTTCAATSVRTGENCVNFDRTSTATHLISIIAAEGKLALFARSAADVLHLHVTGLLIIRTFAFYQNNKKILYILLVVAAIAIAGAIGITELVEKLQGPPPAGDTYGCEFGTSDATAIEYGFLVLFEAILMGLTVHKRFAYYRDSRSPLLMKLYWDGLIYMSFVLLASLFNIIIKLPFFVVDNFASIMDSPQLVIHGVLASRIFFNLRETNLQTQQMVFGSHIPLSRAGAASTNADGDIGSLLFRQVGSTILSHTNEGDQPAEARVGHQA